jgi:TolB-like protein/uncharacterized protein YkwD
MLERDRRWGMETVAHAIDSPPRTAHSSGKGRTPMRRFHLLFAFSIFCAASAGAEDMRILVTPFQNNSSDEYGWLGYGIEASVISDLSSVKAVRVIGTQDRKKALEEQSYQLSGLTESEKTVRVGKLLGANLVVSGEYTVLGREIRLTARLSLVEKGTVISAFKMDGALRQIFDIQDEIVIGLLGGVTAAPADGIAPVTLSPAEIAAIRKKDASLAGYEYASRGFEINAEVPQEFLDIERAIFENINKERKKAGVPLVQYHARLAAVSRYHSMNMQLYNFFDLTDQNGMTPLARKLILAPELFGNIGQMIAVSGGGAPDVIAKNYVAYWMKSGFKSMVLSTDCNYIGVGVFRGDGNAYTYYCTVTPALLWVELVSPPPKNAANGEKVELTFRFIGNFPREKVGIVIRFPDPDALYYNKDGSASKGSGLYKPETWDGEFFTITVTCDRGRGAYMIQPARDSEFVPFGMTFISR